MSDFALRGTFYLGDQSDRDGMFAQADRVMKHLLDIEASGAGTIRDAAVSLDASTSTIEIELIVTADTMVAAHGLASDAVKGAFRRGESTEQRSLEMVPA